MRRMYEFKCVEGHVTERLCKYEDMVTTCKVCDQEAKRIISTPQISLEGISGAFPDAAAKWERRHKQHLSRKGS